MINDKGICPYCEKEFNVKKYGYDMVCPFCQELIDVFPDTTIFVETPFGTIGIGKINE